MTAAQQPRDILEVAAYLTAAVTNMRLYGAVHPQVNRYIERVFQALRRTLALRTELTYLIVGGAAVVDNRTLVSKTPYLKQFVRLLRAKAIERITFTAALSLPELVQLVGDLAADDHVVIRSHASIILGKVRVAERVSRWGPMTPAIRAKLDALGVLADQPLDAMHQLFDDIRAQKDVTFCGLERVVRGLVEGMMCNVNPLDLLSSLKSADEYTFTHAINVCILTMTQAEVLGIEGKTLYEIGIAAAMHDAGKMFVPDEILNKEGRLTAAEWDFMRHHSIRGARYILRMKGLPQLAFIAALEHHIRYDGSGYPTLNSGWRPHIVSQMIAVSDLFDAMRSRRPYQDPRPDERIVQIMVDESGTSFNPHLVDNFLAILRATAGEAGEI